MSLGVEDLTKIGFTIPTLQTMLREARSGMRRLICVEPSPGAESKCLHLEGFSQLWVEELEGGRCLAWALEGARGCTVSLGWGVGEGEACFRPLDPSLANWKGGCMTREGLDSFLISPVFPKGPSRDQDRAW